MGRKKGSDRTADGGPGPRRGMRRSIRYEAVEELPDPRRPARDPGAPPAIMLRKLRAEVALERLEAQLRAYAQQGIREVLVVHGKGQNSPGGVAVIGPLVRRWCDQHGNIVASWDEAPARWGGAGAIVVQLR